MKTLKKNDEGLFPCFNPKCESPDVEIYVTDQVGDEGHAYCCQCGTQGPGKDPLGKIWNMISENQVSGLQSVQQLQSELAQTLQSGPPGRTLAERLAEINVRATLLVADSLAARIEVKL